MLRDNVRFFFFFGLCRMAAPESDVVGGRPSCLAAEAAHY